MKINCTLVFETEKSYNRILREMLCSLKQGWSKQNNRKYRE